MLSFRENIPIILKAVENINPKRVVDVGAGMGKYGLLIREQYLSAKAEKGELKPVDDIVIHAIEDTEYLLTDRLYAIYDLVIDRDVFKCGDIFEENHYDLALLIDTIEHWGKEETLALLKRMNKQTGILISTPKKTVMYEEHFYGDPRHHQTQWEAADIVNEFPNAQVVYCELSHIIYIPKQ